MKPNNSVPEKVRKLMKFTLEIEREEDHPEGHFDNADDVASVIDQLERGNAWAWCLVKVTAEIDGVSLEGTDYLGACSYKDQDDFEQSGYYEDMCNEAARELFQRMQQQNKALNGVLK